jgi:hypothetical protein
VAGKSWTQPLIVKMDPRVKTSALGLQQQSTLSKQLYDAAGDIQRALRQLRAVRDQVKTLQGKGQQADLARSLAAFDEKAAALEGPSGAAGMGGFGPPVAGGPETLAGASTGLTSIMGLLQGADATPTMQVTAAAADRLQAATTLLGRWKTLTLDLNALNTQLTKAGLAAIVVSK